MEALIRVVGTDILCRSTGGPAEFRLSESEAIGVLDDLARRYDHAVRQGDDDALPGIGRALFDRLDPGGWATAWARGTGPRMLEIRVDDPGGPSGARAARCPLGVAGESGRLSRRRPGAVIRSGRRVGVKETPVTAPHGDVRLIFVPINTDLTFSTVCSAVSVGRQLDHQAGPLGRGAGSAMAAEKQA